MRQQIWIFKLRLAGRKQLMRHHVQQHAGDGIEFWRIDCVTRVCFVRQSFSFTMFQVWNRHAGEGRGWLTGSLLQIRWSNLIVASGKTGYAEDTRISLSTLPKRLLHHPTLKKFP